MKTYRSALTIGGWFLTASLALAQVAPPVPPVPPAAPAPRVRTTPAPEPTAAMRMAEDALNQAAQLPADLDLQLDQVRAQLDNLNLDLPFQKDWDDVQDKLSRAREQMVTASARMAERGNSDALNNALAMQARTVFKGGDDAMYQNGLKFIDNHQYDLALSEFNNVVARAGVRAEGALYWKAYVLDKLGRVADAQAAIDTLRKTYPNSRWLDDAKALELEVKQSKGPVALRDRPKQHAPGATTAGADRPRRQSGPPGEGHPVHEPKAQPQHPEDPARYLHLHHRSGREARHSGRLL